MTESIWRRAAAPQGLALPGWGFDGAVFDLAPAGAGLSTLVGGFLPPGWNALPLRVDEHASPAGASPEDVFNFFESAAHVDWLERWSNDVHGAPSPPQRQVLVGWSLGAWFALAAARARPSWWRRVVLVGAPVQFDPQQIASQRESLAADPGAHLAAFRQRTLVHERAPHVRAWARGVGDTSHQRYDVAQLDLGLQLLGAARLRAEEAAAVHSLLAAHGASLEFWHGGRDAVAPLAPLKALLAEAEAIRRAPPPHQPPPPAADAAEFPPNDVRAGACGIALHVSPRAGHACFLSEDAAAWWNQDAAYTLSAAASSQGSG